MIIPTQEEIAKACPVTLDEWHEREFANWRVEFPRPAAAAAAVGATEEGGGANGSAEAGSSGVGNPQDSAGGGRVAESATPPTLALTTVAPGARADSQQVLKEKFGDEILFQKPLPEGGAAATREMTL